MFSLFPKFWSVCRVEGEGADLIAYADKRHIVTRNVVTGESTIMARVKGPTLAMCETQVGGLTALASAGVDKRVRLWHPSTGREIFAIAGFPSRRINTLCSLPRPDGPLLAAGENNGVVVVMDSATGDRVHLLQDGGSEVTGVCHVTVDGADRLVSVAVDGVVRVWDYDSGALLHAATAGPQPLHAVCAITPLTANGRPLIAAAGEGFVINLWDPATGEHVRTLSPQATPHTLAALTRKGGTIYALTPARTTKGVWLAAGGDFPGVWLWNPANGRGAGWIGWGGATDRKPECSWVRGLATYSVKGDDTLVACGYDSTVGGFPVTAAYSFDGF